MEPLDFTSDRVLSDKGRLYTISSCFGKRVYGERLVRHCDLEFREWDPHESKLGAYLAASGRKFLFDVWNRILYLSASSGTTTSLVANMCSEGKVYFVKFAQRIFRNLVRSCEDKPVMIPIMGDAIRSEGYTMFPNGVDVVYQDMA